MNMTVLRVWKSGHGQRVDYCCIMLKVIILRVRFINSSAETKSRTNKSSTRSLGFSIVHFTGSESPALEVGVHPEINTVLENSICAVTKKIALR